MYIDLNNNVNDRTGAIINRKTENAPVLMQHARLFGNWQNCELVMVEPNIGTRVS